MPYYNKKIYKSYNFKTKRGVRHKKAKWRQQKLAVGTVQKIAREIAKKEDKKNLVKHVHTTQVKATGIAWTNVRALPSVQDWKTVSGTAQDAGNGLSFDIISEIGGNVQLENQVQNSTSERSELELRVNGVECFGVVKNNASRPARIEVRLVYIPNLNQYTNASIDYIQPRLSMFFKSGKGSGNLLNQGYNKRYLGASDATGIPPTFTTLARKVLYLPAATISGIVNMNNVNNSILMDCPSYFKKFKLAKYFKNPKRAYVRGDEPEMTNGNYFLCYWSDLQGSSTFSFLATTNLQYTVKAPMNPDDALV